MIQTQQLSTCESKSAVRAKKAERLVVEQEKWDEGAKLVIKSFDEAGQEVDGLRSMGKKYILHLLQKVLQIYHLTKNSTIKRDQKVSYRKKRRNGWCGFFFHFFSLVVEKKNELMLYFEPGNFALATIHKGVAGHVLEQLLVRKVALVVTVDHTSADKEPEERAQIPDSEKGQRMKDHGVCKDGRCLTLGQRCVL